MRIRTSMLFTPGTSERRRRVVNAESCGDIIAQRLNPRAAGGSVGFVIDFFPTHLDSRRLGVWNQCESVVDRLSLIKEMFLVSAVSFFGQSRLTTVS